MNRIQKVASSVFGMFQPEWLEFLFEDLEGYELARVRSGRYPEEEPVYFVMSFARKLGFSTYQDFSTVRQVLTKKSIYLFWKHKEPYGMFVPGISEIRGHDGRPLRSRRDSRIYDILLRFGSVLSEVDWRSNEMIPEDFYSS